MSAPRRTLRVVSLLALVALAGVGCAKQDRGIRHELTLGEHHLSVRVPEGWKVLSFGREVRVSHGGVVLTLGDLGPAGPEGIQREVERARGLWKKGQLKDAQWVLKTTPVPDELFGTLVERTAFWAAWSEVTSVGEGVDPDAVDEAFERIRENVAAIQRPDAQVLAGTVLETIEPKARRDIETSHKRLVSGREAVVYRTWDRLTHGRPRKVAIVFDKGYALKLDVEKGSMMSAGPAFEGLLDSLRFTAPEPASGPAVTGEVTPGLEKP